MVDCTYYTEKLRMAIADGSIRDESFAYLRNMQDTRSNSFRIQRVEDDLQRNTKLMRNTEGATYDIMEEENNNDETNNHNLDELLDLLDDEVNDHDELFEGTDTNQSLPQSISLKAIRNKGAERCGYNCLAGMKLNSVDCDGLFLEVDESLLQQTEPEPEQLNDQDDAMPNDVTPTQHDIVTVLVTKRTRRNRTFEEITKSTEIVNVLEANGSAKSIIDWAIKAKLDKGQRRAFEIITSTFVLTYYVNSTEHDQLVRNDRHIFVSEKRLLQKLAEVEKRNTDQLILLLHGPGGSGKTTVIDLVMKYAEEYCSYLENYEYSTRTILLTAMTGVAATILMGETTHSAVYLNQKRDVEAEQVEAWTATRLLIIDEISFASKSDFEALHKKIRRLKQQLNSKYGGLNIIFAGDFRQMEPVGAFKKPIYEENCPEFKDWVNCFIELTGMHRFKNDPQWGLLLKRFRDGTVTREDINKINECVVKNDNELPNDIKYATFFNRDRDSINTALFEERCKDIYSQLESVNDAILIFVTTYLFRIATKSIYHFETKAHFGKIVVKILSNLHKEKEEWIHYSNYMRLSCHASM